MAMDILFLGVHAVNMILLLLLIFIYAKNYTVLKMKHTLGMLVFAGLLLLQTAMGLYFSLVMQMFYSSEAAGLGMLLEVVKAAGLAVLLWISLE